jgi:hypothetical protein
MVLQFRFAAAIGLPTADTANEVDNSVILSESGPKVCVFAHARCFFQARLVQRAILSAFMCRRIHQPLDLRVSPIDFLIKCVVLTHRRYPAQLNIIVIVLRLGLHRM